MGFRASSLFAIDKATTKMINDCVMYIMNDIICESNIEDPSNYYNLN